MLRIFCAILSVTHLTLNLIRKPLVYRRYFSTTKMTSTQSLLMIPGPTEYDSAVLRALAMPTVGHMSPIFTQDFSVALANLKFIHGATAQCASVILSGSGTLGWDLICANLAERGDEVLIINTGYFSDSWSDCCVAYGLSVTQIRAKIGETVSLEQIKQALSKQTYQAVLMTQVDTSTAVLNDIQAYCSLIKQIQPRAFLCVDGVCSFGGENFAFSDWGVDAASGCSQKSIGCPPGLCTLILSERAQDFVLNRTTPVPSYFGNLQKWLPVMQKYASGQPSYFATPVCTLTI